jgi:hypothetical protein
MKRIDLKGWKPFTLECLFDVVKGSRLTKADMKDGDIRYIGATAFNNGITNYIGNSEETHPAGTLTVCYNGSIGQTYYQDKEFWATDDVNVLYPKFAMTKYIALFIAPIIKAVGRKYAYTDKWKIEDMKTSVIYLPVDEHNQPDWEYMEHYMNEVEAKVKLSVNHLVSVIEGGGKNSLDISSWGTFKVGDLFKIHKPTVYHTYQVKEDTNGIPYVVRSKYYNGIKFRVAKSPGMMSSPGGVISFGSENAAFFYQNEEWCSGRDIYYIDTRSIPSEACLFLVTCLQTIAGKYSYSNGLFPDLLRREFIKLPVDAAGCPDWEYMKDYMSYIHCVVSSLPILH